MRPWRTVQVPRRGGPAAPVLERGAAPGPARRGEPPHPAGLAPSRASTGSRLPHRRDGHLHAGPDDRDLRSTRVRALQHLHGTERGRGTASNDCWRTSRLCGPFSISCWRPVGHKTRSSRSTSGELTARALIAGRSAGPLCTVGRTHFSGWSRRDGVASLDRGPDPGSAPDRAPWGRRHPAFPARAGREGNDRFPRPMSSPRRHRSYCRRDTPPKGRRRCRRP
jgi:hypothetical protein